MTGIIWGKSSYSAEQGNCVELGTQSKEYDERHIRDSQNPENGHLTVDRNEMLSFLVSVK